MRLQSLIPAIPTDLVAALDVCGIKTDTDFLFSGTPIDILQKLPPGVVGLADLKTYIALVAERASARGIPGDQLYAEELQKRHAYDINMTCGVDELDALVNGFGGGRVFEISGDRGSGKTSLVSQIALRLLAAYKEASVLWMDTTGDFSAERFGQLAQQLLGEGSSTALERLEVSVVLNIETARTLLDGLESSANALSASRVRLVIIDSVTCLLAPSLSAVSSHGHAIMTTFMQHLRSMARSHYLAFLIVNNTSASLPYNPSSTYSSTTRKPALGPSFTYLTDCTVWLARQEDVISAEAAIENTVFIRDPQWRFALDDTVKVKSALSVIVDMPVKRRLVNFRMKRSNDTALIFHCASHCSRTTDTACCIARTDISDSRVLVCGDGCSDGKLLTWNPRSHSYVYIQTIQCP